MVILRSQHLTISVAQPSDAVVLTAYRNDPEIAKYQDWELPVTFERTLARLEQQVDRDDVTEGHWVSFVMRHGDAVVGDVVAHFREGGGIAEIGYTLSPAHHGRGYASEGAATMVDHLIANHGVQRIEATLDPRNVASMRVLERLGLQFECLARSAFKEPDGWSDDLRYAMTAADRTAWLERRRTRAAEVELVEITPDDAHLWGQLRTHHSQEQFVSPMASSFRDALFPEIYRGGAMVPWMRGVLADGERVGFVMLGMVTEHHPEPYLWRLLIDRMHQRRGLGSLVLAVLIEQLNDWGHTTLTTSWGEGHGSPEPFYLAHGFVPTGEMDDDEVIGRLRL